MKQENNKQGLTDVRDEEIIVETAQDSSPWKEPEEESSNTLNQTSGRQKLEGEDYTSGDIDGGARQRMRIQPVDDGEGIKKLNLEAPMGLVAPTGNSNPNFLGKIGSEKPVGPVRKESLSSSEWEKILQHGGAPRQPSTSSPFVFPIHSPSHSRQTPFDPQRLTI